MGPTRTGMNLERTVKDRPARDIIPLEVSKIRTTISSKLATVGTHTRRKIKRASDSKQRPIQFGRQSVSTADTIRAATYTSLLVRENDWDYLGVNLDRI